MNHDPSGLKRDSSRKPIPAVGDNSGRFVLVSTVGISLFVQLAMVFIATRHRLHSAEVAFINGEYRTALKLAEFELRREPNSSQALLIAGLAARELKQPDLAIRFLARVPNEGNQNTTHALTALANFSLQQGRNSEAERLLRQALDIDASHAEARDRLIYLLVLEGRIWEAQQFALAALRSGNVQSNHLIVLGSNKTELGDGDQFATLSLTAVPTDPLALLPEARKAYKEQKVDHARGLLRQILAVRPEILEVQSQLGVLLAENEEWDALCDWNGRLPLHADDHPGIWYARGLFAAQTGQHQAAIRCFGEALVRQPSHVGANYQMSQVLKATGKTAKATECGNHARDLIRLEVAVAGVTGNWDMNSVRGIVELLESLGRYWEAAGWCHLTLTQRPSESWSSQSLRRLESKIRSFPSLTLGSFSLADQNLVTFPLPVWKKPHSPSTPPTAKRTDGGRVAFTDEAGKVGLEFTYLNGASSGDEESMFQLDGGGVAVLDYDGDRWPDIYLSQGGILPTEMGQRVDTDKLFRNLGNGRFLDVTSFTRLRELGYSQGVTVGDVNGDGFPDLYVANIGPNSLYLNNGDGTFTDDSLTSGTAGKEWTSSCVLADFNGDALPDLYVVNYLGGDTWTRKCLKSSNRCSPDQFSSEPDRMYLNLGNGQFEDVTESAGIMDHGGRGLGVVAADFDDSHRISLFVGNDMSPNFFFANQTPARGLAPSFRECGLLQGLAVDSRGVPKASMGIAVGDANGDSLFDLFVTNFYRESNNLFVQRSDHTFVDGTRAAHLAESGFLMLGWGTQFLDGELDGFPDLIVTNGHVHQPSDPKVPYHMSPQYFRNLGKGQFEEDSASQLGEFFAGKYLGRGLARLDWNRDGLEEACISHLDSPAALLLNRTSDPGNYLAISLVGVESDRDAIGTTVRVLAKGKEWLRQLTAGDGFQASNQRQLVFGLGKFEVVEQIEVNWISGNRQSFSNLATNREYLLIEGRSHALELSHDVYSSPYCASPGRSSK